MKHLSVNAALVLLFFSVWIPAGIVAQESQAAASERFRVMFYNVENLFDPWDDSLTRDEEFTPEGERYWTNYKFYDKLNKVYKVIMAVGRWEPPAVIGLCEVENRFVLEKLISETPLKGFGYRIVHHESPDRRGIDVALLYREELFEPLYDEAIRVRFPDDTAYHTRDILYVKGLIDHREMIHFFVNHWPSRYGGYLATVNRRNTAASILKHHTDSLLEMNPNSAVVMMGDFNDGPRDESFSGVLQAVAPSDEIELKTYYNLMLTDQDDWSYGTLKYRENWDVFDQVVVSGSLLNHDGLDVFLDKAFIFHESFLLEDDERYLGIKPFRTFTGFRYNGGFSDHLPVFFDLIFID